MIGFDHIPRTRLVYGAGAIDRLGALMTPWAGRRVLLVTDPGVRAAGHPDRARAALHAEGFEVSLYAEARENPTSDDVAACAAAAREAEADALVALGGGSAMDTAKACNFLLADGGSMRAYWGKNKVRGAMKPFVAVPTTAGTGSECQSFALITDPETHRKMACGDDKARARLALLDPELTLTLPARATSDTGIDALTHAVETAVTRPRNEFSLLYSREAFRLISASLPRAIEAPGDIEARGELLLGASYAGTAIAESMLGAAHALANPLTARFGIPHGRAVGMALPHVVGFNAEDETARSLYRELAVHGRLVGPDGDATTAIRALLERIAALLHAASIPETLSEARADPQMVEHLAEEAEREWTGQFNPRCATQADFHRIYEQMEASE